MSTAHLATPVAATGIQPHYFSFEHGTLGPDLAPVPEPEQHDHPAGPGRHERNPSPRPRRAALRRLSQMPERERRDEVRKKAKWQEVLDEIWGLDKAGKSRCPIKPQEKGGRLVVEFSHATRVTDDGVTLDFHSVGERDVSTFEQAVEASVRMAVARGWVPLRIAGSEKCVNAAIDAAARAGLDPDQLVVKRTAAARLRDSAQAATKLVRPRDNREAPSEPVQPAATKPSSGSLISRAGSPGLQARGGKRARVCRRMDWRLVNYNAQS
jgi:hypothetical protein